MFYSPFQEYFTYAEPIISRHGQNPELSGKIHLAFRKSGTEVKNKFMLALAEHEIFPAHKC